MFNFAAVDVHVISKLLDSDSRSMEQEIVFLDPSHPALTVVFLLSESIRDAVRSVDWKRVAVRADCPFTA